MLLSLPEYDVMVMEDVMIPARDGIRLATDIYRPAKNGALVLNPLPIILQRTPYNKRNQEAIERNCRYFARRGYIFAIQDCRACFGSEGEFGYFWQEGPDGYDTIEWLASQPWSNGKIGTTGTSYAGWAQVALAAYNPPHLVCMWVNEGPSNGYTSSLRHGGALEIRFLTWLLWHAANNTNATLKKDAAVDEALSRMDIVQIVKDLPFKANETPLKLIPSYERNALNLLTRGDYDDLWKDPSINFQLYWDKSPDVPVVFSSGWYDSYTRATVENYVGLSQRKNGPYRLVMGPWTHGDGNMAITFAGGIDLGQEAPVDYNHMRLRWYDRWLKDMDTGVDNDAPVRIFVMGGGDGRKNKYGRLNHGGYWRDENEWPIPKFKPTLLYLHPDYSLRPEPSKERNSSTTYTFDPNDPAPTIGGNISALSSIRPVPNYIGDPSVLPMIVRTQPIVANGGWDQRERKDVFGAKPPYNAPLNARSDILTFETLPLDRDVEVTGHLEVKLWVSSNVPDTDFTAKLIDVYPSNVDYPDGYALNISDSIFRMRYRDSWEKPKMMETGQTYAVTITLYPTSNLFATGHKIRLDISSSNFPRFDINPNTGEPLGRNTHTRVASNTVHHSADSQSHVVLSLSPSSFAHA